MPTHPLVSIAICIYNGAKYLPQQLDSIFNQTYPNFEVIAVDDCSTDGSRIILNDYAGKYPNMRVLLNESNLGYVKNFEKAIKSTSGTYIALSDHDDIWHPEKIEKQVEAVPGNILVYHDSQYIDEENNDLNVKMSEIFKLSDWNSPIPFFLKNCISGHTILFHRSLIEHALPLDKNFFHDWWLAFVATNIGTIKYIPLPLVKYRQHLNNTVDILGRNADEPAEKKDPNPLLENKDWILHCSQFKGKYAKDLKRIHHLIRTNISIFKKIRLFFLLDKFKDEIFAINIGPVRRNRKNIKKMVWELNDL